MRIGNDKLSCLLYADDIVVMSDCGMELQQMLDVVSEYGRDFAVKFSSDKSEVMVINGNVEELDRKWKIGNAEIGRTNEYRYLGCVLNEKGCEPAKNDKIFKANQWYGRLGSVARFRANKYECIRGLWKGVAVPGIMYGMEVMHWTENELARLDVIQNKIGRVALGAKRWTGVEAVRGDMGWSQFGERVTKSVLKYKVRMDRMGPERWVKRVHVWSNCWSKWSKDCWKRARKCGCRKVWNVGLNMRVNEWRMVDESGRGQDWDMKKWKRWIDEQVKTNGVNKWRAGMRGKPTLKWYENKVCPEYECCYDGSYSSELLFKARTQSLEVNARTYRWSDSGVKVCDQCGTGADETVEHLVLECDMYDRQRQVLIGLVVGKIGMDEWIKVRSENDHGMCMLLGFSKGRQTVILEAMKVFLLDVWNARSVNIRRGIDVQP